MVLKLKAIAWYIGFFGLSTSLWASDTPQTKTSEDTPSGPSWIGPQGQALPFTSHDEALDFLRRARVVSHDVLQGGSTRPLKVLLEVGRTQAHAVFRDVDIRRKEVKVDGEIYQNFHDSHIYECAAYELSRWLGINNVPPCVERQIGERQGTLQLWIERSMTESERREKEHQPPNPMRWAREKQILRLFDALIANIDRNQGNMLLDAQGKLWFIDHTRSFGASTNIANLNKIVWCDHRVWSRLQELDSPLLEQRLSPLITKSQLRSLRTRGDRLRQHLEQRMQDLGPGGVLFDLSAPKKEMADHATVESDDDFPANTTLPDLGGR